MVAAVRALRMGEAPVAAVTMRLLLLHRMNQIRNQTFHMRLTFSFSSVLSQTQLWFSVLKVEMVEHIYSGGVCYEPIRDLTPQFVNADYSIHILPPLTQYAFRFYHFLISLSFKNIFVLLLFIYKIKIHM